MGPTSKFWNAGVAQWRLMGFVLHMGSLEPGEVLGEVKSKEQAIGGFWHLPNSKTYST